GGGRSGADRRTARAGENPARSRSDQRRGHRSGAARAPGEGASGFMSSGFKNTTTFKDTTVVILAAGLGTRMRSKRAKVLHRAGGLALVEHVAAAASAVAPADRTVAVTGHQADEVEAVLAPLGVSF